MANRQHEPPSGFPIVGIGASAGGLAAFEAFFTGMPADTDTGMAFVLVQHLAPDHKSILTDLVQRYTSMQVFEVEDGMTVQPDCTYIIPPGRDMAFLGGNLQLLEPMAPRGQRMPIDFFFRSLAEDQREHAIGIVLSGTGSDGTLGVRAIKGNGGMVMVQTPDSTEHDGMPRSALATGLVDYELPPAEMPAQIITYVAGTSNKPDRTAGASVPRSENALNKILILLRAHAGHDFSQYKPSTVHRRIERRMAIHQIETMDRYVSYLQQAPAEIEALFRDMLIGVTNFFRDPEAFKVIEQRVVPELFARMPRNGSIRVWSAGCSTGEEAYSLAILLAEHQETLKSGVTIQVFATDIDSRAIATARAGRYPSGIAADVTRERLSRFFTLEPGNGFYRIHKNIRDMLVFSEQNVVRDPPFSRLDLVCCRNLLIYMGPELQKRILPLFHYALNPGGFLFLGTSETVGAFGSLFATLDRDSKLYQRKEGQHRTLTNRVVPPAPAAQERIPPPSRVAAGSANRSPRELTERALLQHSTTVAALVGANGDILYLHGRMGLYLEPAPGEAGVDNILKMAREGLRRELAMALSRAAASGEEVRCRDLQVKSNGDVTTVDLTVRVLLASSGIAVPAGHAASATPPLLIVILQPTASRTKVPESAEHAVDVKVTDDIHALVESLRRELIAKEEYLQATNEELESTNEELRSSNEEMQSVNEELQSTNEELETSKEELQSVNEELSTVNAELHTKVADLTQANNDINNLLAGTGIATIFVDHDLRILRFTPTATRIINLIRGDVGRPIDHIASNLVGYDGLSVDTQAVLDNLEPREVDVQTKAGEWYTMRILPYRTVDNVIEGAVVTFANISTAKLAQEALHQAHRRVLEAIVATVREPLLVLDTDLRIVLCNRAFFSTFQISPEGALGRSLYEIGHGQWNIPALRTLLEKTLPRDQAFHDHMLSHEFENIGPCTMWLNGRVVSEIGQPVFILLAIEVVKSPPHEEGAR